VTLYPADLERRFKLTLAAVQRDIGTLQTRTASIDSGVVVPRDPWHNVTGGVGFAATEWADEGAPYAPASYRFEPARRAGFRGRVVWTSTASVGLASGQDLFTLPRDYWPARQHTIQASLFGANGTLAANRVPVLEVLTTGVVQVFEITVPATAGDSAIVAWNSSYPLD
jgi:hypothetical protein